MTTLTATLVITTIPDQTVGVPFKISATYQLNSPTWTEALVYQDNGGTPTPIPAPEVQLGTSSLSFTHPGLPAGQHTVKIRDRLTGTLVTSNVFNVGSGKAIVANPVTGAVAGQAFTFSGTLTGYAGSAPALRYQLDGGASQSLPGVTIVGWSTQLTIASAGSHTLVVSDGTVTSNQVTFTVSPQTVNHVIAPNAPAGAQAGVAFTFTGSLTGYSSPPSLTYSVNNSTPVAMTGVTSTGWSMSVVAPLTPGSYNYAVSDGTTSGVVTVAVGAAPKVITPTAPSNVVAGQSFTFTGVLSGYSTIPALTYSLDGGAPVTMTGVSTTGWAMTVAAPAAGQHSLTVTDGTTTSGPVTFTVSPQNTARRQFYQNPGMDGSFWVKPQQTGAAFITSGAMVTALRSGSPSVNLKGNFAVPWYIGTASDPLVTVTDGTHTEVVRVPLGAALEAPASPTDQSIGGADATRAYFVWSISGATMYDANGNVISAVQASGTVIKGTYGFAVNDGAGLIMVDQVTGEPGDNNSIGGIQDYELQQISVDPNYVIQHMLAFQLDVATQASLQGPIWPLKLLDTSSGGVSNPYQGPIPQGVTVMIPANVARPVGQTRGFYALWDQAQQFGLFNYNFGQTGGANITIYDSKNAYSTLVSQMVAAWPTIVQNLCILNYDPNVSGSQYSLATTKGATPGSADAFPSPPPLDLSPTGGQNVAPSTFGAWYPSGYNAIPSNGSTSVTFIITPAAPSGAVAGVAFTFSGTLSGYASAPSLTYSINGGAAQALSGVTSTGWSTSLTVNVAGPTTVVVNDVADAVMGTVSFQVASSTPTVVPVTWDPATVTGGIVLSNGGYTATTAGSTAPYGAPQGVRATSSVNPSQLVLGEARFVSGPTQNSAVGLADSAAPFNTGGLGATADSIGFYVSTGTGSQPAQTVYQAGNQLTAGNGVSSVTGDVVTFVTNGSAAWFSDSAMRSTAGVQWNNSATANPAAGVGGFPYSNGQPFFPTFYAGEAGSSVTLNDGTQPLSAFAAAFLAANPQVVTLSGQAPTGPAKAITPAAPNGVVVGAPFTFTGTLTGYATAPNLTYSLNGAAPVALPGVTVTGWSTTLTTTLAGNNTIVVSDGSANAQVSFSATTQGGNGVNRVIAPLSGAVTKGAWVVNQRFTLAGSPSGLGYMQYNYLPPAQYNPSLVYPVLFVGHPIGSGMNGSTYPKDGTSFVTGASFNGYSLDSIFNTVAFRTAHPCWVVACQCDQTGNSGGTNANGVPGYNDSQNSTWNEQAEIGILQAFVAGSIVSGAQIDPGARYHTGYSLGGIDTLAQLVDNNQYNGPGVKLWTAGVTYSDQLFRPGTPNSAVFGRMSSVPLLTISTTSDNVPSSYDQPAWTSYTGNASYPTQANYDSGGMPAIRAGNTNYYYINFGSGNPASTFMPMNADGGDGDKIYAWLFSQISGAVTPTITGVFFTPAASVVASSPVGTVAGVLAAGSANGALTGLTYALSSTSNFTTNGANVVFNSAVVPAGTYPLNVTVAATNASNSPQAYPITIVVSSGSLPPGVFSVRSGKVIAPDGSTFIGRGVAIPDFDFASRVTNAACQPLLTQFPGTNIVRLSAESGFWSPSTYSQQINWLTAQKIVVCIENHRESNGATGGGGQGVVYSGTLLQQEQAWYSALASTFVNNTYVWFGTCNEPPINPSLLALWQWQQTTYNTIRATGSTAIVEIEQYNPYLQGSNSGLSNTIFSQMYNIVYGPHYYSWIWNGNGSTTVPQGTIYSSAIGSANSQWGGIVQQIATLQTLTSLDGVVPVGCFEFGPSTDGTNLDVSGMNCVNAVIQAVNNNNLFCYLAWWYDSLGTDNLITSSGAVSSPYGTTIAQNILSGAPPVPPAPAQSAGYVTRVFFDDFNANSISYQNNGGTYTPGTGSPTFPRWYTSHNSGALSSSNVFISNGVLSFSNAPNNDGAQAQLSMDPNPYSSSAAVSMPGAPAANTGNGVLYTYGYYKAVMSFPTFVTYPGGGFPAWWGTNSYKPGANPANLNHVELDFLEFQMEIDSTIWQWGPGLNYNNAQKFGAPRTTITPPAGFDPTKPNAYACLWTPTQVGWYINDQLVYYASSALTNPLVTPNSSFPSCVASTWPAGVSGFNPTLGTGPNWPLTVYSVEIWQ